MLPERNLRSRMVPPSPSTPNTRRRRNPIPPLSPLECGPQLPDSSSPPRSPAASHDNALYTQVRLRLHPRPGLVNNGEGGESATVTLCYHNGYWQSRGPDERNLTVHFHHHERISHTQSPSHVLPLPTPPNYIIQCNDINLWLSEDEDDYEPQVMPVDPANLHVRRHSRDKTLALCTLCVAIFSTIIIIIIILKPSKPIHPVTSFNETTIQTPFVRGILPILDQYKHICLEEALLPSEYVVKKTMPLNALREYRSTIETTCYQIREVGGLWDETNGLRMDPWEYSQFKRKQKIPDGAVDISDLCKNTTENVGVINDLFYDTTFKIAYGLGLDAQTVFLRLATTIAETYPSGRSPSCSGGKTTRNSTTQPADNTTRSTSDTAQLSSCEPMRVDWISSFKAAVESEGLNSATKELMDEVFQLQQNLELAVQSVDLIIHIAAAALAPKTGSYGWLPNLLPVTNFQPEPDSVLNPMKQMRKDLNLIRSTVDAFVEKHQGILVQEDQFITCLQDLLAWSNHHNTTTLATVHDLPGEFTAGTWHPNPWARWRSATEREEWGQWCTLPACPEPEADGENVLVKLYLPNAEDAYHMMYDSLEAMNMRVKDMRLYMAVWKHERWMLDNDGEGADTEN